MRKTLLTLFLLLLCSIAYAQHPGVVPGNLQVLGNVETKGNYYPLDEANLIFLPVGMGQTSSKPDRSTDNLYMLFDSADTETADIPAIILPSNFDANSSVTYRVVWENDDDATDAVLWVLYNAVADGDGAFGAFSSGDDVTDTNVGASTENVTASTTVTESWTAGDIIKFHLSRVPTDGRDTGDSDAIFRCMILNYKKIIQ